MNLSLLMDETTVYKYNTVPRKKEEITTRRKDKMAAAAPPRIGLHRHDFEDRQIEKSSLETLLQMGFSIQRAYV